MILEAKKLCKKYEENQILDEIDFSVDQGEFVAIMGQSGCGKSTLLYSVSGMDKDNEGEILFEGKELATLKEKEISRIRLLKMGFVFQKPNLLSNLSVLDNIVFPGLEAGQSSRSEINARAKKWMERTGIADIKDHDIRKVSGGQLQRAAICRALINQPDILFGDEPTGALNSSTTKEIMDIFQEINEEGCAILLVTHDARVAGRAQRVIYLEDGKKKDELILGKYQKKEEAMREMKMAEWLNQMGF